MRVLRYIALAVDALVAVLLGGGAVLLWFMASVVDHPAAAQWVAALKLNTYDYAAMTLFGFGLLGLNLSVAIDVIKELCCPAYLKLRTPNGQVSVSTKAIEDALRAVALAVEGVDTARVRVSAPLRAKRPVVVRARVTLWGGIFYHDVSRAVAEAMEYKFADIVGKGVPLECHVYWEKIKAEGAKPEAAKPKYGAVRPQFPVETEEDQVP